MITTHVVLTNVGAQAIQLPEVDNRLIRPGEDFDLCFPGSPYEYDYEAALRAINDLPDTALYKETHGASPQLTYLVYETFV